MLLLGCRETRGQKRWLYLNKLERLIYRILQYVGVSFNCSECSDLAVACHLAKSVTLVAALTATTADWES